MNDTELFPALKTKFEDPDAENQDMVESLFDHKESQHQNADQHEQDNAQNEAQVRHNHSCQILSADNDMQA